MNHWCELRTWSSLCFIGFRLRDWKLSVWILFRHKQTWGRRVDLNNKCDKFRSDLTESKTGFKFRVSSSGLNFRFITQRSQSCPWTQIGTPRRHLPGTGRVFRDGTDILARDPIVSLVKGHLQAAAAFFKFTHTFCLRLLQQKSVTDKPDTLNVTKSH